MDHHNEHSPETSDNGAAAFKIELTNKLLWPDKNNQHVSKAGTFDAYELASPLDIPALGRVYGYIPATGTFVRSFHDNPFEKAFCSSFTVKSALLGQKKALQTKLLVDGKEVPDDRIEAAAAGVGVAVQEGTRSVMNGVRSAYNTVLSKLGSRKFAKGNDAAQEQSEGSGAHTRSQGVAIETE